MHEIEINSNGNLNFMHINDISMHESESFDPKCPGVIFSPQKFHGKLSCLGYFMNGILIHEFLGKVFIVVRGNIIFMHDNVIFIHGNSIFMHINENCMHGIFMPHFLCMKLFVRDECCEAKPGYYKCYHIYHRFQWAYIVCTRVDSLPPITGSGPALTAVWSTASPLTARCLSPLPGFESRHGDVRNLPAT